ncbi:hypothetical protein HZB07_01655 [Candidatus Saganbacteria bacterium]|nr:hypothetical protein [Candidatus Saganbacteria bacterium]
MINNQPLSLEEITKIGEKFYTEELKEGLERSNLGQYVVIDVETKKYDLDADRLVAVERARKSFGDKLFYIIQIGSVQNSNINFTAKKKYAWDF